MSLSVHNADGDAVVACFDHLSLEILVTNSEFSSGELLIIRLTAPSSVHKRHCTPKGSLYFK